MKCECGSYAINHGSHGRDGSSPNLCDVCYWRDKNATTTADLATVMSDYQDLGGLHAETEDLVGKLEEENKRLSVIEKKAITFVRCRNTAGYDDAAEKSAGWYLEQALSQDSKGVGR